MNFFGSGGSGDLKRVIFVALTAGLVLIGVTIGFMLSVLKIDGPSVDAQTEALSGQETPARSPS